MITVAKTAGFCFGVSRAIDIVEKLIESGSKVTTLGPIIHNPQMVGKLAKQGVKIADCPEDADSDTTVVIRSHGVTLDVMNRIEKCGLSYKDATCPFVLKIHKIVAEHSAKGEIILIAGDETHPEVQGIIGSLHGEYHTFKNCQELRNFVNKFPNWKNKPVCVGCTDNI